MKKAPMILVVLACISSLTACSGGSSNTPNSSSQETSSVLSSESSSKESSSSEISSSSALPSIIQSSSSLTSTKYKNISMESHESYPLSMEVPVDWVVKDSGCDLALSSDHFALGSFFFSIENDQIYSDDYFETLSENTPSPMSFKKLGAPISNEYCFSLEDGTKVYLTTDGAMSKNYFNYQFIKDEKLVTFTAERPNPGVYDEGFYLAPYTDEEVIHVLSSLTLES